MGKIISIFRIFVLLFILKKGDKKMVIYIYIEFLKSFYKIDHKKQIVKKVQEVPKHAKIYKISF